MLIRPRRRRALGGLGLWDATAMAVGGMIGGGIFTVLGVAIAAAGHLAAGCFVLGMFLAAATARSYAAEAGEGRRRDDPFAHLRRAGHPGLAGLLLWLLVVGYVAVMAVYSFTFGRYAANALGAPGWAARLLSVAVVTVFLAVNVSGVVVSRRTEDAIVAAKLGILALIALVGMSRFSTSRLTPLADRGVGGMLVGAAIVFVAYEGFELLAYDRDDLRDPAVTLPKALYLSVAVVACVYIAVTLGAQMLASDASIVAHREIAFTVVGQAALGSTGRWLAIVGALFATTSAINATIFSAARLVHQGSAAGELPAIFCTQRRGQPVVALAFISFGGAAMAMLPRLTEVISFASATFLVVYAVVNWLHASDARRAGDRIVTGLAAAGCLAALVAIVVDLAADEPAGVAVLGAIGAATIGGHASFRRSRGRADRRSIRQR